jgi:hypothetical protein
MSSRPGGYSRITDVKADFRMFNGRKILTNRQNAELVGQRQTPIPDAPAGWQSPDMQTAAQAGASY